MTIAWESPRSTAYKDNDVATIDPDEMLHNLAFLFLCVAFFLLLFSKRCSHVKGSVPYEYFRCGGVLNRRRHVEHKSRSVIGAHRTDEPRTVVADRGCFGSYLSSPLLPCARVLCRSFVAVVSGLTIENLKKQLGDMGDNVNTDNVNTAKLATGTVAADQYPVDRVSTREVQRINVCIILRLLLLGSATDCVNYQIGVAFPS